ncbi:MAG TPA: hypothetical protein EYH18_02425, partial [Aquifex sp.]|nr:hypothetical protein [Aquifex sp.]
MFFRIFALTFTAFLFFSCGEESSSPLPPPKAPNESYIPLKGEEREFQEKILRSVFPPSWEVLDIYLVIPSE